MRSKAAEQPKQPNPAQQLRLADMQAGLQEKQSKVKLNEASAAAKLAEIGKVEPQAPADPGNPQLEMAQALKLMSDIRLNDAKAQTELQKPALEAARLRQDGQKAALTASVTRERNQTRQE